MRGAQTGNNSPMLSHITRPLAPALLNIYPETGKAWVMKNTPSLLLCALLVAASPAAAQAADCYADYKAKQDNPLRLHYGVAQINGACTAASARAELAPRLANAGWTLLNIVSVFDKDGLAQRKQSAGSNYLRF